MIAFKVDQTEVLLMEVRHQGLVPRTVWVAGGLVAPVLGARLDQTGDLVRAAVQASPGATHALVVRQNYRSGLTAACVSVRSGQAYEASDVEMV